MKFKFLAVGILGSVIAGAAAVPVAFAAQDGSTTASETRIAFHDGEGRVGKGHLLETVAGVLWIAVEDLKAALQEGQTIREIAGDQADAVASAVANEIRTRIEEAVTAGKITRERADEMLSNLDDRVNSMLDRSGPFRGHRGFHGRHGGGPGCEGKANGETPSNGSGDTEGATTTQF